MLALTRPFLIVGMTLALTLALVACSAGDDGAMEASSPKDDLCRQIVPMIENFQDGIDNAETADPVATVEQTTFAAQRIASAIDVAKRTGDEFSTTDQEWIDEVELSAQAYLELNDPEFEGVSDEDALEILMRIDEWFRVAADECLGTSA